MLLEELARELDLLLEELAGAELATELALLELAMLELEGALDLLIDEFARLDLTLSDELATLSGDAALLDATTTTAAELEDFTTAELATLDAGIVLALELD